MAKNFTVSLPITFSAFKHRNFRLYWLGNMVSSIGTGIQNTAKGWFVLSITNSPFFVGLDSTLSWLAVWFVSLPAGVLADRLNKRNLMILTQSALAFFAILLALLTWLKLITITPILIISGFAGIFVALNASVAQTLVPELVEKKDILNAIALSSSMFKLAQMIGPALAGSILTFTGPAVCFALNSASFLTITIALSFIKLNTPPPPQVDETFLQRLGSGLKFVKSHPDIRLLMIMTGVFSSFGICIYR